MESLEKKPNPDRDPVRMSQTLKQAETMAFTTQFFYFTMKVFFSYILLKYNNTLTSSWLNIFSYVLILAINAYLILKTGRDPGYQPSISTTARQQENNQLIQQPNTDTFCDICQCYKKIRSKHCFKCGRCVRKFDHHCPWIGACVGEKNQCMFCVMTFMQTVQAVLCFWICITSLQLYQYKDGTENYGQQFGVFAIFSIFMFIYILFVASLFLFHSYLILTNTTTTELMYRSKAKYLHNVRGNPFNTGLVGNLSRTVWVPDGGQQFMDYIVQ